jgi:AcrR family transcriptional regulator
VKGRSAVKTRMTGAERRDSILHAAIHVFVERSYAGATTAEIAREAECNEALIFRHFGSKLDLFTATLARATELICEEAEAGAGAEGSNLDQLRELARHKGRGTVHTYRDLGRLRFVAAAEAREPAIAEALRLHLDELHEWTAARLRAAKTAGELPPSVDPGLAAWEWSSAITLMTLRAMAGDPGAAPDFERIANALIESWRSAS